MVRPTDKAAFERGLHLHNDGAFFEAHEAWEELWRAEQDIEHRRFLQGLIQVTAAFHKLFAMHRAENARSLLTRGLAKLDRYPSDYLGVSLGAFRDGARVCLRWLDAPTQNAAAFDDLRAKVPRLVRQPVPD